MQPLDGRHDCAGCGVRGRAAGRGGACFITPDRPATDQRQTVAGAANEERSPSARRAVPFPGGGRPGACDRAVSSLRFAGRSIGTRAVGTRARTRRGEPRSPWNPKPRPLCRSWACPGRRLRPYATRSSATMGTTVSEVRQCRHRTRWAIARSLHERDVADPWLNQFSDPKRRLRFDGSRRYSIVVIRRAVAQRIRRRLRGPRRGRCRDSDVSRQSIRPSPCTASRRDSNCVRG